MSGTKLEILLARVGKYEATSPFSPVSDRAVLRDIVQALVDEVDVAIGYLEYESDQGRALKTLKAGLDRAEQLAGGNNDRTAGGRVMAVKIIERHGVDSEDQPVVFEANVSGDYLVQGTGGSIRPCAELRPFVGKRVRVTIEELP